MPDMGASAPLQSCVRCKDATLRSEESHQKWINRMSAHYCALVNIQYRPTHEAAYGTSLWPLWLNPQRLEERQVPGSRHHVVGPPE